MHHTENAIFQFAELCIILELLNVSATAPQAVVKMIFCLLYGVGIGNDPPLLIQRRTPKQEAFLFS